MLFADQLTNRLYFINGVRNQVAKNATLVAGKIISSETVILRKRRFVIDHMKKKMIDKAELLEKLDVLKFESSFQHESFHFRFCSNTTMLWRRINICRIQTVETMKMLTTNEKNQLLLRMN